MEMRIHGTYPFDSERQPWKMVKKLEWDEVKSLIAVPEELVAEIEAAGRSQWGWKKVPFINKGYIIVPRPGETVPEAISSLTAGLLDCAFQVGLPTVVGTRAVYLHDGEYLLIERYSPAL